MQFNLTLLLLFLPLFAHSLVTPSDALLSPEANPATATASATAASAPATSRNTSGESVPALTDAIELALHHSVELFENGQELNSLQLDRKLLALLYLPSFNLQYSLQEAIRDEAPDTVSAMLHLQFSQPIPSPSKLIVQLKKIGCREKLLTAHRRFREIQTIALVKMLYSQIFYKHQSIHFMEANLNDLKLLQTIIQKKVDLEQARELDLQRIQMNVSQAENHSEQLQSELTALFNRLSTLLQLPLSPLPAFPMAEIEAEIKAQFDFDIDSNRSLLLQLARRENFDLNSEKQQLALMKLTQNEIFLQFIPEFTYQIDGNIPFRDGYRFPQQLQHQLSLSLHLPGLTFNQAESVNPVLSRFQHNGFYSGNVDPKGWKSIAEYQIQKQHLALQEKKIALLETRFTFDAEALLRSLCLLRKEVELSQQDIQIRLREKEIGKQEYQMGKISLFEWNKREEELDEHYQRYNQAALNHFETFQKLLLLCNIRCLSDFPGQTGA